MSEEERARSEGYAVLRIKALCTYRNEGRFRSTLVLHEGHWRVQSR
jgi:hypothetical protein